MKISDLGLISILVAAVSACQPSAEARLNTAADEFWVRLTALCGATFNGVITETNNPDNLGRDMQMHVSHCDADEIHIQTHSRSGFTRTKRFVRHPDGFELRHDYRYFDGSLYPITGHGGFATNPGTESAQVFPADHTTVENVPAFWDHAWYIELQPGDRFVYQVHVVGTSVSVRTEYDLSQPAEGHAVG